MHQKLKGPTIEVLSTLTPISDVDQKRLDDARAVDLDSATVVVASFENRYAAAGGVRAVTQEYAKYLSSQGKKVLVLTPLHMGLGAPPGPQKLAAVLWIDFKWERRRVEVFEDDWQGVRWIYISCKTFFEAEGGRDRSNPYLYDADAIEAKISNRSPRLALDCVFFAVAAPKALAAIGLADNMILHLQDWETAAVAVTAKSAIVKKEIGRAASILALHNPYDNNLDSDGWATLMTGWREPVDTPSTFLGRSLPFLDAPPATVSREFANDLTTDKLQTHCLADHLQKQFTQYGIDGVDNGPFERRDPPFSDKAILAARQGQPDDILAEKQRLRDAMKRTMSPYKPPERWGDVDFASLLDEVPVFMCVGRLDPGQKGFDVLTRAIEEVLNDNVDANFVLTPVVGSAPQAFVDDLRDLAEAKEYAGRVVVYPFRMQRGYSDIQAGCTFSLWPSIYEPFGGVSEFFLRGTPVIARSTGGLRQQVINFNPTTGEGNGLLYTTIDPPSGSEEWRRIEGETEPRNRMKYPIYVDQVEKLANAIRKAVDIFDDRIAYGRLLSNVPASCANYSWRRAADEYASLYKIARN